MAIAGTYGIAGYAHQDAPSESQSASGTLTLNADLTYSVTGIGNSNLSAGVEGFALIGSYTIAANGAISLTSTEFGDTLTGFVAADGTIVVALTSINATSEELYVAGRIGGTFSAATVAGTYGIAGY